MNKDELLQRIEILISLLTAKAASENISSAGLYRTAVCYCEEIMEVIKLGVDDTENKFGALHRFISDSLPWSDDILKAWDKVERQWRVYNQIRRD